MRQKKFNSNNHDAAPFTCSRWKWNAWMDDFLQIEQQISTKCTLCIIVLEICKQGRNTWYFCMFNLFVGARMLRKLNWKLSPFRPFMPNILIVVLTKAENFSQKTKRDIFRAIKHFVWNCSFFLFDWRSKHCTLNVNPFNWILVDYFAHLFATPFSHITFIFLPMLCFCWEKWIV